MITCDQYDFVEIACMYRMPLLLTFKNGSTLIGVATNIVLSNERKECLKVLQEGLETLVCIDDLESMRAIEPNPNFSLVIFHGNENVGFKG